MPLYEFKCVCCGHTFEDLIRNPAEEACCPTCGAKDVQRLLSKTAPGLVGVSGSQSVGGGSGGSSGGRRPCRIQ